MVQAKDFDWPAIESASIVPSSSQNVPRTGDNGPKGWFAENKTVIFTVSTIISIIIVMLYIYFKKYKK